MKFIDSILLLVIKVIAITFGVFMLLVPVLYWVKNPEMTEMEIFIKFWHFLIIGFFTVVAGGMLIKT